MVSGKKFTFGPLRKAEDVWFLNFCTI